MSRRISVYSRTSNSRRSNSSTGTIIQQTILPKMPLNLKPQFPPSGARGNPFVNLRSLHLSYHERHFRGRRIIRMIREMRDFWIRDIVDVIEEGGPSGGVFWVDDVCGFEGRGLIGFVGKRACV